jgi:hypothetical protein
MYINAYAQARSPYKPEGCFETVRLGFQFLRSSVVLPRNSRLIMYVCMYVNLCMHVFHYGLPLQQQSDDVCVRMYDLWNFPSVYVCVDIQSICASMFCFSKHVHVHMFMCMYTHAHTHTHAPTHTHTGRHKHMHTRRLFTYSGNAHVPECATRICKYRARLCMYVYKKSVTSTELDRETHGLERLCFLQSVTNVCDVLF